MKKIFFGSSFITLLLVNSGLQAQVSRIDTIAVLILQRMSATLTDLHTCSFTVNTSYDLESDELGLVTHSGEERVYMHKPDKLMVAADGDNGRRAFWYNGKTLSYYAYDKNLYAQIAAPPTILQTVDAVNKTYGVEFPAADFFYPSFVDDILDTAFNLVYLGMTDIEGKPCFHIAGTTADMSFQFWIHNDEFFLPAKLGIVYTDKEGTPQYRSIYSDWKLNPELPMSMFEFNAPPKAGKLKLLPKSGNK